MTRCLQDGDIDMAVVNGLIRSPQASSLRPVVAISVEALLLLGETRAFLWASTSNPASTGGVAAVEPGTSSRETPPDAEAS